MTSDFQGVAIIMLER